MFHTFIFPTTYQDSSSAGGDGGGAVIVEPVSPETSGGSITSSGKNINLYQLFKAEYGDRLDEFVDFTVTINETQADGTPLVIGSTASGLTNFAIDTGTGWRSDATLTLINNGIITGRGGDGGDYSLTAPGNGDDGGSGIIFRQDWTVTNNNLIQGGGGGGGGGDTPIVTYDGLGELVIRYSNGGGGGGDEPGNAGGDPSLSGDESGVTEAKLRIGGQPIGTTNGGAGGAAGAAGSNGQATGGAAGYAIDKDGNTVTVTNNDTIRGSIIA